MDFFKLVERSRSCRRFVQDHQISTDILEELVNLARLSPSSANRQPLRFQIYNTAADCNAIFPSTRWAGYLNEWDGPVEGERPSAYIIILGDKKSQSTLQVDMGIAAQSIMLGAAFKGLGGCMIASLAREELRKTASVGDEWEILLVVALGKPAEKVVVEKVQNNEIKYWRDSEGVHHVPKRSLDELILNRNVKK